ncbi:MAG: histidine--tRNA ligase [Ignavibacteriales bacterium]|nr:MAG: histidine--tRNA ligase [Ignavibacteriaceae bacterium]MBW7872176.1 histidine--tRNA ligase [Ignavibacteria bacterium]MCZ2143989.1 histidine--tRNA ligase [Ignavibacteriales bacterium]OQY74738.1 MAG: histidine--tRNA ligase [Ignavibacteriales bacterium UTCHB3]MBV6445678.1 Histidine--tRNA ligase [Ignavibacteriaceae bacterium]
MNGMIPKKIKGFRDIDPELNELRQQVVEKAGKVYELYGFRHWDTPVLEYAENLGKYLPDKETVAEGVYSFRNPETEPVYKNDGSELRDENDLVVMDNHHIAMRYDLTAPLARMYAEELFIQSLKGQLTTNNAPLFRRYQYGPVYRFEAKLDPGRFREFWQLDFDTVGTADVAADAEACMVLSDALEAIGLEKKSFVVRLNNRKILSGFLSGIGIAGEEDEASVLRVIDKIDKIGIDGITAELGKGRKDSSGAVIPGLGLENKTVNAIANYFERFVEDKSRESTIEALFSLNAKNEKFTEGMAELTRIDELLRASGYDEEKVLFSPSIVRGLGYYTGPVYEVESLLTFTDRKGNTRRVGSICGGGRYDGLVERLLGIKVPATGASIGVDRLCELLLLSGEATLQQKGTVLITVFDDELMGEYQKISAELRSAGIPAEIYYGAQRGLKKQIGYADKMNSPVCILLGSDEFEKGVVTVRNLALGKELSATIENKDEWKRKVQKEVSRNELVETIKEMLGRK